MWVQSLGWEDSPRGGHGHPLPYSCLENPSDRGASGLWSIRSQRVQHNWNNSMHTCTHTRILVRKKRKKVKSFSRVQLFAKPMDCTLPGFFVHGIFQARVLKWVASSFSRGSSRPRKRTQVSCTAGRRFTLWATREAPGYWLWNFY